MSDRNLKEVKSEVMDLLNQIVVLTKGIKAPETGKENYNYQALSVTDLLDDLEGNFEDREEDEDEMKEFNKWNDINKNPTKKKELLSQVYLANVHAMAKRVVSGDASAAEYNEQQYYNSNC